MARLRWCGWVLVLTLAGCHRAAPPPAHFVAPPRPKGEPAATGAPATDPAPAAVGTPKQFPDLGLSLLLTTDWAEGAAPADAGPGAKLLHQADADLPWLLLMGVAPRSYEAKKKRDLMAGHDPLDEAVAQVRSTTGVPGASPVGDAGRDGQVIAEQPWAHPSVVRGKMLRVKTTNASSASDGSGDRYLDFYIGEPAGGGLYTLVLAAKSQAELNGLKKLISSLVLTGPKDEPADAASRDAHAAPKH
jgi:hypothetical protein